MLYCHTTSKFYCPLGLIMGRFPSDFLMCGHPPSSKAQWQLDPLIFSGLEFFKTFFNFKIQRAVQTFLVLVLCTCGWAIVAIFQSSSARKYLFLDDKKNCWNFAPISLWTTRKWWQFAPMYSTWPICVTNLDFLILRNSAQSEVTTRKELSKKWNYQTSFVKRCVIFW